MTSRALVWTCSAWRTRAERWIHERLIELGYSLVGTIDHAHVRPWGTVARVPTDKGPLWFKANIAPLAFEAALVEQVAVRSPDGVPRLVAADGSSGWMLMEDAGAVLFDVYGEEAPAQIWQGLLRRYAELQLEVAPVVEALVAAGVPDCRSPNLVAPFEGVLESERLVCPPTNDALNAEELDRVRALIPRLLDASDVLAALELPDSVQHDDLHLWNVCVGDDAYTFIDWGDACVAQPMVSLAIPLAHIARDDTHAACAAYFEPWTELRSPDALFAARDAAVLLGQVTGVLKWQRINAALSDDERVGYEHAIPSRLRRMLELACA